MCFSQYVTILCLGVTKHNFMEASCLIYSIMKLTLVWRIWSNNTGFLFQQSQFSFSCFFLSDVFYHHSPPKGSFSWFLCWFPLPVTVSSLRLTLSLPRALCAAVSLFRLFFSWLSFDLFITCLFFWPPQLSARPSRYCSWSSLLCTSSPVSHSP